MYLHITLLKSTIFRTITDESTGAVRSIGLFGRSITDLKASLASIKTNGFFNTIFNTSTIDVSKVAAYNAAIANETGAQEALAQASVGTNKATINLIKSANGAAVSTEALTAAQKASTVASKALSVGMKLLSVAMNVGIALLIPVIIKGIDKLITTKAELAEKAEEVTSKFREQKEELTGNRAKFDELAEKYEKLSKGVNALGENLSLTSDEYEEYHDVVNQIASMFPSWVKGWDEQGNAILDVKGNVEDLTQAYNDAIIAANNVILKDAKTVFGDFKNDMEENDESNFKGNEFTTYSYKALKNIINSNDLDSAIQQYAATGTTNMVQIVQALKDAGLEQNWNETGHDFIKRACQENSEIVRSIVGDFEQKLETETAGVKSVAEAYIGNAFLGDYSKVDKSIQGIVKQMVSGFDAEFYSQFDSVDELYKYLKGMLDDFANLGKEDTANIKTFFEIQTKFNNGEITVAEYQEKLSSFLSAIDGLPEETQKAIKLLFGITTNDDGTTSSDVDTMVKNVKDKFKSKFDKEIGQLKLDDLEILADLDISPEGIESWSEVETLIANAGKEANKMTDSLDSLSSAIKAAESAFELFNEVEKDFNSTGAISAENIQKILNKFPELEDELYEYIMGMRTGASVMDLLKTKSDDMATMSIKAFKRMYLSSNSVSQDIKDDYESAFKLIGLEWDNTQSVMANVNTQIVDANGQATQTFVEQWTEACKLAGANVSTFAQGISALLGGDFYDGTSGVYRVQGKGIYYKDGSGMDGKGTNLVNVKAMELIDSGQYANTEKGRSDAYKAAYNILSNQMDKSWENQAEFERRQKEFEERMKQYATTSDDKSGSDKNESLDNYLKDAENRYKIHQDEAKYIEELQWAHDNLTKDEKVRLDIIGKINEAYRDLADNRIKDLEHQIDLKKELYGEDYDATSDWAEIQRIAHEEAKRLRDMGYDNNSNEVQELQKTWWDAENKKRDFYSKQYENRVRDIEHARDMALNADENANVNSYYKQLQDEYHREAERLRALDPEKYKEEIQELQQLWWDAQNAMLDYNKQVVDDFLNELQTKLDESYDIRISRLNSESSLLSSHFGIVNAIAEEQHNLNKELLEAETIGARMNEQERESLFTKAEHTRLSGKLSDIMLDITDLQHDYMRDLENATSDTIEEITNHYERQYELKMKEYEIVKAELSLAKAQQVLENTENEKSVRTWNGSSWVYEANLQDVISAQEDVENARYELARAQAEEAQQVALNAIDSKADALETEKNKFATAIDEMAEKMSGSGKDITDMLKTIADADLPAFDAIIRSMGDSIKEALNISDEDINAMRINNSTNGINEQQVIEQMKANSAGWHTATTQDERDALAIKNAAWGDMLGLDYDPVTGRWKKKDGTYAYASGTKNAKKGAGLFDENGFGSELILTDGGVLTQFNGGERVFSPEMADRLWEMAQQNYNFTPMITHPDMGKLIPIEDKINNAISNISNAFGDTYMLNGVQLNESEGGTLKGFINFLKKKI